MTLNEYQSLAARTIDKNLTLKGQLMHSLHGLSSEVGEIHSIFQKQYQGHRVDEAHLKSEAGDLMWFLAELCTAHGWELEEVAQGNIDKLTARYPNGFEAERSLHRAEGDI